jgi:hypothetical protein
MNINMRPASRQVSVPGLASPLGAGHTVSMKSRPAAAGLMYDAAQPAQDQPDRPDQPDIRQDRRPGPRSGCQV